MVGGGGGVFACNCNLLCYILILLLLLFYSLFPPPPPPPPPLGFAVIRVLLDSSIPGNPVVAERVLLQPFHMLLALERNLCAWYTQVPMLIVNLTMGELNVS